MRFIRWLSPVLAVLLFLTACQHQPKEIGLTAVSSAYQKQHAQHQNDLLSIKMVSHHWKYPVSVQR